MATKPVHQPAEQCKAFEIDHTGGHVRSVMLSECHHLLSGARRDAGRRDDGERHRLLTGGVRRLEHRLREEGYEPITSTLWG
jgi:hypothetical protein